jgi:hypothetical protein
MYNGSAHVRKQFLNNGKPLLWFSSLAILEHARIGADEHASRCLMCGGIVIACIACSLFLSAENKEKQCFGGKYLSRV